MVQLPVKKKAPTGNKRGRPKAMEVAAKTNHKMDEYYRKKQVQTDAVMTSTHNEEEKKETQHSIEGTTQSVGYLRVQVTEETKAGAFMTVRTDDPLLRRELATEQMRKSKRKELISKRRQPLLAEMVQELEESEKRRMLHELRIYGLPGDEQAAEDRGLENEPSQPMQSVAEYLNNN